jgi:hypothetical protein
VRLAEAVKENGREKNCDDCLEDEVGDRENLRSVRLVRTGVRGRGRTEIRRRGSRLAGFRNGDGRRVEVGSGDGRGGRDRAVRRFEGSDAKAGVA